MNKTQISIAIVISISVFNISRCDEISPQIPPVSMHQAKQLFSHIRQVTKEYLTYRTPAEKQKFSLNLLPVELKDDIDYPISVIFRRNGRMLAKAFSRGRGLEANAAHAAIKALRCPGMGDYVAAKHIDSLAIELEIMGPEIQISKSQVVKNIIPGLTGLKLAIGIYDLKVEGTPLARAYQEIRISPAEQYRQDLSPADTLELALRKIEDRPKSRDLKSSWALYRTMHFVDYPKVAKADFLYRGKILELNPGDMRFLMKLYQAVASSQQPHGEIIMPNNRQGHLWENAFLAYSLKKAANAINPDKNENLANFKKSLAHSGNIIMGYFAKEYISMSPDGIVRVVVPQKDNAILTASFLLMASKYDKPVEQTIVFRKGLKKMLTGAINKSGKVLNAANKECSVLTQAVLLNALIAAPGTFADHEKTFHRGLDNLLARCGVLSSKTAKAGDVGIEELAWTGRAIIMADKTTQQQYLPYLKKIITSLITAQQKYAKILDQTGGLIEPMGGMKSIGTAGAASTFMEMSKIASWPQGAQAINLALEFCWMMSYRNGEAYYAAKPDLWVGWVRNQPQAAEISIHATAAVIDALATKIENTTTKNGNK